MGPLDLFNGPIVIVSDMVLAILWATRNDFNGELLNVVT